MGRVNITMPKMGESVAEATIIRWLKQVGQQVEAEESVLEIATDKVDSEIPSPEKGVLVETRYKENEVVRVGDVIAVLEVEGKGAASGNGAVAQRQAPAPLPAAHQATAPPAPGQSVSTPQAGGGKIPRTSAGKFYSPLVRSIAEKEGLSVAELDAIKGSGSNERVTKKDILSYLGDRSKGLAADVPAGQVVKVQGPVKITLMDGDEVVEMDRMRKLIADHMVMSKHTSPHVTSMVEVDVTNIVNWRNRIKDQFEKREGEKLTFTPIFFEQIVKAIRQMPGVNVSVDGSRIIKRKHINLGMATADRKSVV